MKYFTPETDPKLFACPCKCGLGPSKALLKALDATRGFAEIPISVNSGPRCFEYNDLPEVGGSKNSEHLTGDGADVHASSSRQRHAIVSGAVKAGVTRIGIGKNFIHLGVSNLKAQRVIWLYD